MNFLLQVLLFEKQIEALHITRSMQDRADRLVQEADRVNDHLMLIGKLSNLSLLLYSWYINNGHARNEEDIVAVTRFFSHQLPAGIEAADGFYEKLYLYQSYCWYAFISRIFYCITAIRKNGWIFLTKKDL